MDVILEHALLTVRPGQQAGERAHRHRPGEPPGRAQVLEVALADGRRVARESLEHDVQTLSTGTRDQDDRLGRKIIVALIAPWADPENWAPASGQSEEQDSSMVRLPCPTP